MKKLARASLVILAFLFSAAGNLYSQDTTTIIDANRMLMFAGNDGIVANDFFREISDIYSGLFYDGDLVNPVMFASGLWIVGKVRGEYGTSMAYYSASRTYTEFAPGPYKSDIVDSSLFKVYKITREDLITPGPDWTNWPVDFGAPLDSNGQPLLIGDQTLFSIYNDADTSRRDFSAGSVEPMGSEVRQIVHAYDKDLYLGDLVFVDFEIENKSSNVWDSIFVGMFADPDLGEPSNDLVGSYPAGSMVYGYSSKFDEEMEGLGYPVVGVIMLGGKKTGYGWYEQYSSTFTKEPPFFPITSERALFMLRGLDSIGEPMINPITMQPSTFIYDGDPRYQVGWLDTLPQDRRSLVSRGPFKISPGEVLTISVAYAAARSENIDTAFTRLFDLSEKALDWYNYGLNGLAFYESPANGDIIRIDFTPDYQNWMMGIPFSGDFAGTGIGKASEFFGSSRPDSNLYSVELKFSYDSTQSVYYYDFVDDEWQYAGFLEMPVRAFGSSDGRQLDMIYLSQKGRDCDHCFINPRTSKDNINRLIITGSSYTGQPRENLIMDSLLTQIGSRDLLYLLQFQPKPQARVNNIQEGQKLTIEFDRGSSLQELDQLDFPEGAVTIDSWLPVFVQDNYQSPSGFRVELSNPLDFSFEAADYLMPAKSQNPVYLKFNPESSGGKSSSVRFYNTDFEEYFDEIMLSGTGRAWPLEGDINLNGWLEPSDIAAYLGYLYSGYRLPTAEVPLDLDGSGKIDLADVVTLINILFIL
jgi:hypothetical protein